MGLNILKRCIALLASLGLSLPAQAIDPVGFWSMAGDRAWSEQELDKAFALFKQLKAKHGDRFNVVVQDLHKEGSPMANGEKTAQIVVKIYVSPPDREISEQLKRVGMVFVREPVN